jgi:PAS domain S-box-containing protein
MDQLCLSGSGGPVKANALWHHLWRYVLTVGVVVLAAALQWALDAALGTGFGFITFYPAVAIVGMVAGGRAGLLATALSAGVADLLFLGPRWHLAMNSPANWVALGLFVTAGALMSGMAGMLGQARKREWQAAEREKGLEQLRLSEARYRLLFDKNPDGVFSVDTTGRFIMANAACEAISGYPHDELLQKTFMELCAPDQVVRTAEEFRRSLVEGRYSHLETALIRKDCRRVELWISGEPVISDDQVIVVHCAAKDITERKRAEEALRESEERFHHMFERHQAVMLVIEPESWAIVDANLAAAQFYRFSCEELRRMRIEDINQLPPEEVAAERRRALEERRNYFIFPHLLAGGESRWVEVYSTPLVVGGRSLLFSVIHDITERKRMEEALSLSEEKFAVAFSQNPAAIAITRLEDGLVLEVNDTWVALNGYGRDEVVGRSVRHLPIWPTPAAASRFVEELKDKGSLRGWEQEFRKSSEEVYVAQLSAQILSVRGEKVVLSTLVDITKRKRAEDALRTVTE